MGNDEHSNGTYCSRRPTNSYIYNHRREISSRNPRLFAYRWQHHRVEGPGKARRVYQVRIARSLRIIFVITAPLITLRSFPDRTRGVLNEGGLFGERAGWHLPGFDTSSWVSRPLSASLPSGGTGVGFFVTTFELDVPQDVDALMSLEFDDLDQPYRALLFVNGWQFGKVGPPVCLQKHGTN